jgi:hypothetical protein
MLDTPLNIYNKLIVHLKRRQNIELSPKSLLQSEIYKNAESLSIRIL